MIDNFNEEIPVAWPISNLEDILAVVEILKAIKERTGLLFPKWFTSDDTEQYFLHGQWCLAKAVLRSCCVHGT